MHSFIQRNKKKLLAVFGVALMIVFLISMSYTPGSRGSDHGDVVYGKAGDVTIKGSDVEQAKIDLVELKEMQFRPLLTLATPPDAPPFMPTPVDELVKEPHLYVLLQHEATAAGVAPAQAEVDRLYDEYFNAYKDQYARMRAGGTPEKIRQVQNNATEMKKASDAFRATVRRFLLVRDNFARVTGAARVTPPQLREQVARAQGPVVNVVEFAAADQLKDVPPPTTQRVNAHYAAFADKVAGDVPANDPTTRPAAFGYRVPTKVRVQYVTIPFEEVAEGVVAKLSGAELDPIDEVAQGYYERNVEEFAVPPDEGPSTRSLGPTTAATRPIGPTTKPFVEVLDKLRTRIAIGEDPAIQRFLPPAGPYHDKILAVRTKIRTEATKLQDELRSRLLVDFGHYQAGRDLTFTVDPATAVVVRPATNPTTGPTTGPTSNPAAAAAATKPAATQPSTAGAGPFTRPAKFYETLDYLDAVAADFYKSHRVHVKVEQVGQDSTKAELALLPNVGTTETAEKTSFADLVMRTVSAGVTTAPATAPAAATQPAGTQPAATQPATTLAATAPAKAISTEPAKSAWSLYEPLPVLKGSDDGYVARLTKFEGGRSPTLDEARPKIEEDLKNQDAFAMAEVKARKFQSAIGSPAQNSPVGGAPVMAPDFDAKVVVAGPVTQDPSSFSAYPVTGESAQRFQQAALSLRVQASVAQPHPSLAISLPADRKAVVIELRDLRRTWTRPEDFSRQILTADQILGREIVDLAALWFSPKEIAARTKYVATRGGK